MKKLILVLFLFITGLTAKSQTYQADTLKYFVDVFNEKPDTIIVQEIVIRIEGKNLHIDKWDASFNAIITDTLDVEVIGVGFYIKKYAIRTVTTTTGKIYEMELLMGYVDGKLITIGLSRGLQLFLYHIQNELIDGNARQRKYYPYIKDWTKTVLSGE